MAGREKRKRRRLREQRRRDGSPVSGRPERASAKPTDAADRSVSKDDLARERLVPLREGERPLAVTIAALLAALLVLGWLVALVAGDSDVATAAPLALLLAVAAVGMWYARYWAVLGFQVLLALMLVNATLFLALRADAALDVVVGLLLVAAAGTLFWYLIRALARIQMPRRRMPG